MIICIAGMHRSGTSMVARMLNACGFYIGEEKDLIPPAEDNPEGFWENDKFRKINDEILESFNGSWDLPPLLNADWANNPHLLHIRARANYLIEEFSGHCLWAWKDPRNSLTLRFWQTLIPDLKVIVCLRNPYDVYCSLSRRGYASHIFSHDLWLTYYQQVLDATSPENRIITHFDSYFSNPQSELQRLLVCLGLEVENETVEKACKTISVNLRHNSGTIDDLAATKASHNLIQAYKGLCLQAGPVYLSSITADERLLLGENEPILQASVKKYKNLLALANISIDRQSHHIGNLTEAIEQKTKDIQMIQAELKSLHESGENYKAEVENISRSRSWRLVRILQNTWRIFIFSSAAIKKIIRVFLYGLVSLYKVPSIIHREGIQGLFLRLRSRVNTDMPLKKNGVAYKNIYEELLLAASQETRDDYVPLSDENVSPNESTIKVVAFYLPQFHPIPLNDEAWGKGFTEWTNVSKAIPQFVGHYQPRLPGELGFYDLRVPDILKRQIELAKKYGIYGFCFHYYWFNGERLLKKPLDLFLESKEDFPFCICWANENWTRRWDGQNNEVLIAQEHSLESDLRFIQDVSHIFQDKRYMRINGRPVLLVYRPNIIANSSDTVRLWREYCNANGIAKPYLIAAQTFSFADPREVNFDAAIEFPPHNVVLSDICHRLNISNSNYKGNVFDYKEIVDKFSVITTNEYKLFKTVFPSWDNEARKPGRGHTFVFSSPELYKEWLLRAAMVTLQEECPEKRLLFVNAWNEWAEGAYLEPDRKYGYAYLQATTDALKEISFIENRPSPLLESKNHGEQRVLDQRIHWPVIIFQSGKVGSTSVYISLKKKFKELEIPTPVYHAHILENIDQRIEIINKKRANPSNSIHKLMESKEIRRKIDENPEQCWNIISLVRDPVAKRVSAFFQLIDEYIPCWKDQWESGALSLYDLQRMFFAKVGEKDLGNWFDNQIKPICGGIDIFNTAFDKNNGFQIYRSNQRINLIIIRMEDLNRVSAKAFEELMGLENFSITRTNTGNGKPYQDIYEKFKKLPFPSSYLDKEYNSRYARHFYTECEIETFRNRWLEK